METSCTYENGESTYAAELINKGMIPWAWIIEERIDWS